MATREVSPARADSSSSTSELNTNKAGEDSPLIPKYSPEDIECLIRQTSLCRICRVMLGPPQDWVHIHTDEVHLFYRHHDSFKSLMSSVQAGCRLCVDIQGDFERFIQGLSGDFSTPEWSSAFRLQASQDFKYPQFTFHISLDRLSHSGITVSIVDLSEIQDWVVVRPLQGDALKTIRAWLGGCQGQAHTHCKAYRNLREYAKPTRLIYLEPTRVDFIRLVTVDASQHYSYVTLSHRWGNAKTPKLSQIGNAGEGTFTIEALKEGIQTGQLETVTFEDAIRIVRACGFSYIWIDSLCIIQDVSSQGRNPDWEIEAQKMGDIYGGGQFNIVAALGNSSTGGLFPPPDISLPMIRRPANIEDYSGPQKAFVLVPRVEEVFYSDILFSDLLSRGWVQQEVFLSPANLFCTRKQMWWSCSTSTYSQNFPISILDFKPDGASIFHDSLGARKRILIPSARPDDPIDIWNGFLENYIQTSVTVADDRLPAIAGIAAAFASQPLLSGAVCHSGVWNSRGWGQALRWRGIITEGCSTTRRLVTKLPIPSWSPLSCVGKPYPVHTWSVAQREADVLYLAYINIDVSELDGVGRAKTLKGCRMYIRSVLFEVRTSNQHLYLDHKGQSLCFQIYFDTTEDLEWTRSTADHKMHIVVWEFSIADGEAIIVEGLLLKPNLGPFEYHGTKSHDRVWQRCGSFWGLFHEPGDDLRFVEDALQLRRFGICLDHVEEGHLRLQSTGGAVALEDICIV